LLIGGQPLRAELVEDTASTVFVSFYIRNGLSGGKGGFGSLLRGNSGSAVARKTTNFDACRDLQGRRMRHVNNAKLLAEWMNKVIPSCISVYLLPVLMTWF
jgi:hypothetical protein